jgi:hypothetical protein
LLRTASILLLRFFKYILFFSHALRKQKNTDHGKRIFDILRRILYKEKRTQIRSDNLKININFIPIESEEEVSFHIHQMNASINKAMEILSDQAANQLVETPSAISTAETYTDKTKRPPYLLGKVDDTFYKVHLKDIFYLESVDRKIYIYTEKKNYELNEKLYVLEETLAESGFVRISKSMLLNMNKIYSFVPTFSGNLEALLLNNEKVVISRRYVANLKKQLGMGEPE